MSSVSGGVSSGRSKSLRRTRSRSSLDGPRTDVNDTLTYDYDLANRLTVVTQNGLILPGTPDTPVATTYVWDDVSERVRVTQPIRVAGSIPAGGTEPPPHRMATGPGCGRAPPPHADIVPTCLGTSLSWQRL